MVEPAPSAIQRARDAVSLALRTPLYDSARITMTHGALAFAGLVASVGLRGATALVVLGLFGRALFRTVEMTLEDTSTPAPSGGETGGAARRVRTIANLPEPRAS